MEPNNRNILIAASVLVLIVIGVLYFKSGKITDSTGGGNNTNTGGGNGTTNGDGTTPPDTGFPTQVPPKDFQKPKASSRIALPDDGFLPKGYWQGA